MSLSLTHSSFFSLEDEQVQGLQACGVQLSTYFFDHHELPNSWSFLFSSSYFSSPQTLSVDMLRDLSLVSFPILPFIFSLSELIVLENYCCIIYNNKISVAYILPMNLWVEFLLIWTGIWLGLSSRDKLGPGRLTSFLLLVPGAHQGWWKAITQ